MKCVNELVNTYRDDKRDVQRVSERWRRTWFQGFAPSSQDGPHKEDSRHAKGRSFRITCLIWRANAKDVNRPGPNRISPGTTGLQ